MQPRAIAGCCVLIVAMITRGASPMLAQSLPDAPAPHAAPAKLPGSADDSYHRDHPDHSDNSGSSGNADHSSPATGNASKPSAGSTSDDNTFPEEQSKKAANTGSTEPAAASGDAPARNGNKNAADENPFPAEKSEAAAKAAGDSSTSSSSDGATGGQGVSSSRKDQPAGEVAELPREGDTAVIPDPKRAAKDVQVGRYYLDSGDFKGAYSRFREAITLSPDDAEVAFFLAEAARKMNRLDEAERNYKLCLQLDPEGPKAKAAKRALAGFDKLAAR